MKKSSKDVENNLPHFDKRPCFIEFTLANGYNNRNLTIPPHFVRTHLTKTVHPSRAVLKDPSGNCWNITICQEEGNLILQDGWVQFYQDHSLGDDEFLFFKHNGDMSFDVKIFDKSGVKRKYFDTNEETKTKTETETHVQTSRKGTRDDETNPGSSSRKQQRQAPPAGRRR